MASNSKAKKTPKFYPARKRQKTDGDEGKTMPTGYSLIRSSKGYKIAVKNYENVVCHFSEKGNPYSEGMVDNILENLAMDHPKTCFLKICAAKHPKLVKRLAIEKCPTIALIKKAKLIHRVVVPDIFRDPEYEDGFGDRDMEEILYHHGIVPSFVPKEEPDFDWEADPDSDKYCKCRGI